MTTNTDRDTVTVIPAAPGFRYVTLWWSDKNDPAPAVTEQDIVAWQVTTSYSETSGRYSSFAEPICLDQLLTPAHGEDVATVSASGHVTIIEYRDFNSTEDWIKDRQLARPREAADQLKAVS
jgi:hypothetical protein